MIEAIPNAAITLPSINNINTAPIELETAKPSDASTFKSILNQAQSADMNSLSVNLSNNGTNKLSGVENSLFDKYVNMNKSYNSRKQYIADIREIVSHSSQNNNKTPTIATTSDIRQFTANSKIRTNLKPENTSLSLVEQAQNKVLEAAQESARKSQLIGDRFVKIQAWRTNMAIFYSWTKVHAFRF